MSEPLMIIVDSAISDLVPMFLEQRRADLADIERAIIAKDFELVRLAGHAIEGASASYGFDALTALGERLSTAGRARDMGAVRKLKIELEDFLVRVIVKYS